MRAAPAWPVRLAFVVLGLTAWFYSQWLIGRRAFPSGTIGDAVHEWTAPVHEGLIAHPRRADALLIASSAVIDALGLFLLSVSVFGPTVRPFLGLLMLFALRQTCQGLCALPEPQGMIWRQPGFPSLLVTYGTANDLFFSGHTGLAVLGAVELVRWGGRRFIALGAAIALFEACTVLVLRAHYTMDVFTGALTALYVAGLANFLAPACDRALARVPIQIGR